MAQINSRLIFITTSPRTPEKMVPEIKVLIDHFEGKVWNAQSQRSFMEVLRDKEFLMGTALKIQLLVPVTGLIAGLKL